MKEMPSELDFAGEHLSRGTTQAKPRAVRNSLVGLGWGQSLAEGLVLGPWTSSRKWREPSQGLRPSMDVLRLAFENHQPHVRTGMN